jgi:hypothetical protein
MSSNALHHNGCTIPSSGHSLADSGRLLERPVHDMQADLALSRVAEAFGDRGEHLEAERSIDRDGGVIDSATPWNCIAR